MLTAVVQRWAVWAPGVESPEDWERWCRSPAALPSEGTPDVRFLPPLLRRRCSRLSRMMLHVAYRACDAGEVGVLPTVFATRHGDLEATVSLLERLGRDAPLSATGFSHSVHNTQPGLFSIAAGNRRMSSALAAGSATFPCAFLETLALAHRDGGGAALLVVGDEPLPAVFETYQEEPPAAHAVALVLGRQGDGPSVGFGPAMGGAPCRPWPPAIEFLRWLLSDEPSVTLGAGHRAWTWTRGATVTPS